MTTRRQALRSPATVAASFFFSLILLFFFALSPGTRAVAGDAERVSPGDMNTGTLLLPMGDGGLVEAPRLAIDVPNIFTSEVTNIGPPQPAQADYPRQAALFVLLLMLLSAAPFIAWRYHRREFTSPRRLGRRI